jgi:glyoxylase-like metal-dependent hydrolase (beta-lactamase superfamily II)
MNIHMARMLKRLPGLRPVLVLATAVGVASLAVDASAQPAGMLDDAEIHVLPVQGNVYMLVGAGANITVQAGDEGVLVIDTGGSAQLTDKIVAAIRAISNKPIRHVLNTHVHSDHIGANEGIAVLGSTIASFGGGGGNITLDGEQETRANGVAHENVLHRMVAEDIPFGAWPTDTYFVAQKELFFNGEAIQIFHAPAAHTDGDSIIFFRRSDVISTGDVFLTTHYPVIDAERGGSIQGIIAALNHILDLAIPAAKQEGGTMVIPGHGRLCDEADVLEYRDMVTIIRDRIQNWIDLGWTLSQVMAARPTMDYDGRYGADQGPWTTKMFIEAVYRDLSG